VETWTLLGLVSCFSHYEIFSLWFGQDQSPNQFSNSLAGIVGGCTEEWEGKIH
jgi:hypothetical protein